MLLAELVATSDVVASTSARSAKVAALAELLSRLDADEVAPAVAMLAGEVRQGRVGVGWASLRDVGPPGATEPELTVDDLDRAITELATLQGPGSQDARRRLLAALWARATPPEASFLERLLLGGLRQGALEGVMADAVAKAAAVPLAVVRRAAMLAGDLPEVAALALAGGVEALAAVGMQVLRPIQPMLAATSDGVADALAACGRSSVEWKLDGARIQVHRVGDEVKVFTRNLNEVTERLPGVVALVRSFPADPLVLDGEAIGLDDDDRPRAFQDTMSRFGTQGSPVPESEGHLAARFFDCLHVDGRDLLDEPLEDRLAVLARVVGRWKVPGVVTDDLAEAEAVLEESLATGHEGVMVKAATSPYEAGRRGATWRKVKPVRTLDLVVLAAEWGHGRRQGWLSNLHLGAGGPGGAPVMVGKTFKGLTDQLLAWQTEQLLAREVRRDGIVVFVRPELVVEIALDGVQVSRRYPGGVALRFARVKRYRPDKSLADIDPIEALQAMRPGA